MPELIDYSALEPGPFRSTLDRMWNPLRQAIGSKLIPGASAAIWYRGNRIRYAAGLAVDAPGLATPADFTTMYDCASLTKVTVTLPLLLILIDQGKLRLEDPAAAFLPEFAVPDKKSITIRQLLSHTSGFAPTHDFYSKSWSKEEILSYLAVMPLSHEPGTQVVYSDLGFIVLGEIASRLFGSSLDLAARQYLFEPLAMHYSCYCPSAELQPRIAATEFSHDIGDYWQGVVHDENARAMGGVSGHAGLFSTAEELIEYARMWLDSGKGPTGHALLSQSATAQAVSTQTAPLPGSNRGLGWVLKGDTADVSGSLLSPRTFGHTGFTGTSLYLDPELELAVVLLTNRVHYGRGQSITQLRSDFHDAVAAVLTGS